jgi:hypothetical protein
VDGYAYIGHTFTGGISMIDVRDPRDPKYVTFVPAPERMVDHRPESQQQIQTCDVFVDREGILSVTDYNAGLYILDYQGS